MKLVVAIIQPFKLDEVRNALTQIGVRGMTITEVEGFGNQKGHKETYRGAEYAVTVVPKVQIEVAVPASLVDNVVDALVRSARTGQIGDGKIFVTDIDRATRIRLARPILSAVSRGPSPIPLQWCHGDINPTVFPNPMTPSGRRSSACRTKLMGA